MKVVFSAIILIFGLISNSYGQLSGIPHYVKNPQDVADWFSREFKYEMKLMSFVTSVKTPQQTIESKSGQCGDFALLASRVLSELGISNVVAIIKFKETDVRHAICVWRDSVGNFSFISNQKLYHSKQSSLERAVEEAYPGYEDMFLHVFDEKNIFLKKEVDF